MLIIKFSKNGCIDKTGVTVFYFCAAELFLKPINDLPELGNDFGPTYWVSVSPISITKLGAFTISQ